MAGDKNVRIRRDLVPTLESRAALTNRSLNAYVTDVLAAHVHPLNERRERPVGLTDLATDLVDSLETGEIWIVLYGGLPPRLNVVAGDIVGVGPTHVRIGIVGTDRRVLVPRAELTAWWMVTHQDHPIPEIRDAIAESMASALYMMHIPAV